MGQAIEVEQMPSLEQLQALAPHPFAELYHMMPDKDFGELADHIASKGLIDQIVLFQGRILDGRNRYKALLERSIPFTAADFVVWDGDEATALTFVEGKNTHRRHMTRGARDLAAAKMAAMKIGAAIPDKLQRKANNVFTQGVRHKANNEAAKQFNLQVETVRRAARVLEHFTPAQLEWVQSDKVKMDNAQRVLREHGEKVRTMFRTPESMNAEAYRLRTERPFQQFNPQRLTGQIAEMIAEIGHRGVETFLPELTAEDMQSLQASARQLQIVLDAAKAIATPAAVAK